jgi:nicotinate phosphoribosyltransferase
MMETLLETDTPLTARLDYYKPTMSQWAYEYYPNAQVTFRFHNRTGVPLANYVGVEYLQEQLDDLQARGFGAQDNNFLRDQRDAQGERMFTERYIKHLGAAALPAIDVEATAGHQLHIETTGDWPMATFWETAVLSTVNELYFESLAFQEGLDLESLYNEGDRRLTQKIGAIKHYNAQLPQGTQPVQIVDFGTRRHFSYKWHQHVLERLGLELPGNVLLGTSNVHLAEAYNLKPIGTFAHEMPMVCAGLHSLTDTDLYRSHRMFLDQWIERYPTLGIALTDTFGSDFFLKDFEAHQDPAKWQGLRQDSGDPLAFGEKAIEMFTRLGVDPKTKTIVFSDGLEVKDILNLHRQFADRIKVVFGWGTNLTNDLGPRALSIVMKATAVNGIETVKLSDNPAKATGPEEQIERYTRVFGYDPTAHQWQTTVY